MFIDVKYSCKVAILTYLKLYSVFVGLQMGMCVYCKSVVPFNTTNCVVCESPIPAQNQPQASIKLHNKLICTSCGTANPNNLSQCVTCETKLAGQQKVRDIQVHGDA